MAKHPLFYSMDCPTKGSCADWGVLTLVSGEDRGWTLATFSGAYGAALPSPTSQPGCPRRSPFRFDAAACTSSSAGRAFGGLADYSPGAVCEWRRPCGRAHRQFGGALLDHAVGFVRGAHW